MSPKNADRWKLAGAVVALSVAGIGFARFYRNVAPPEGKAYFYDLSSKTLFTAPHSSVPPIKGVTGEEEDGVRAIVISTSGECKDASSRKVAYLEMYTPELKRQVEARQRQESSTAPETREAPMIRRGEAHGFILIKRPEETDWHPMTTPEAQEIMSMINTPAPDGKMPVVCVP